MDAHVQQLLEGLGLGRRECLCYLSLLEIGASRVGPLIKRTGIPSSKIYEILERLAKRGLVTSVVRENVRSYQAASPKVLVSLMDERRRQLDAALPGLLLAQHSSQRQGVELFEGQKALFTLFTDLIHDAKPGEQYMVFSLDEESKTSEANIFFRSLTLRRKEKRLDTRLLKNRGIEVGRRVPERHTKLQLRYTTFTLPQGLTIFRDTVVILSWDAVPLAIKIESRTVAAQWRSFFLDLWKGAKR